MTEELVPFGKMLEQAMVRAGIEGPDELVDKLREAGDESICGKIYKKRVRDAMRGTHYKMIAMPSCTEVLGLSREELRILGHAHLVNLKATDPEAAKLMREWEKATAR